MKSSNENTSPCSSFMAFNSVNARSPTPLTLPSEKKIRFVLGSHVKVSPEKLISGGRTSISAPVFFISTKRYGISDSFEAY